MGVDPISVGSIAVILLALAAGSFMKGITGLGLPLIAVPVMASFLGVEHAVVVMVIPGIVTNAWLLWVHRSQVAAARHLPALLLAGMVGVGLGTWVLSALSERMLSLVLALAIGGYLLTLLLHPRFSLSRAVDRYLSPVIGLVAGVMQGATGISSPVVATYFHALRLDQRAYVFSVTATFQVFCLAQLFSLNQAGLFTHTRFLEGMLALLPIVVILPLSMRLARIVSRRAFDRILVALIVVMEIKFIYNGLWGG